MYLRALLISLVLFLALTTWANMASPIHEGSLVGSPFISQHVSITKEKILIILNDKFGDAQFKIEYHIKANKSGTQIPLLFYASEFKANFRVWIDGKEVQLTKIPEAYKDLEGTPFSDFAYFFEMENVSETQQVVINDSPSSGFYVSINDLKFFEVDLSEGDHIIKAQYVAEKWTDHSDWVKEYNFRYALSPAKYWKSFGNLEITLDGSNFEGDLTTNLGAPVSGDLQSKAFWSFSTLPTEVLKISYQPGISKTASILLAISPTGLAIVLAIVVIAVHFIAMKLFRKTNAHRRFSWVMIAGSIAIPFIVLLGYLFAFDLIDSVIGEEASQYHGYIIFIMVLYPILLPVYWTVMWLVDRVITGGLKKVQSPPN